MKGERKNLSIVCKHLQAGVTVKMNAKTERVASNGMLWMSIVDSTIMGSPFRADWWTNERHIAPL
jgi:hypothetical protein